MLLLVAAECLIHTWMSATIFVFLFYSFQDSAQQFDKYPLILVLFKHTKIINSHGLCKKEVVILPGLPLPITHWSISKFLHVLLKYQLFYDKQDSKEAIMTFLSINTHAMWFFALIVFKHVTMGYSNMQLTLGPWKRYLGDYNKWSCPRHRSPCRYIQHFTL